MSFNISVNDNRKVLVVQNGLLLPQVKLQARTDQ